MVHLLMYYEQLFLKIINYYIAKEMIYQILLLTSS